ncbi:MAG: HNH endonuclease [Candidatus Moranbacteria bacterium]|nr:HNH endonuclease [Candidatus Moranbacteria bacterium]
MPDKRKYADRAEYMKHAVAKRRKAMRARAVEYKGGRCSRCGYDRCDAALEFHHVDGQKDFGISQDGLTRSWERIRKEIEKCILICSNCHREEHVRLRSLSEKSESEK